MNGSKMGILIVEDSAVQAEKLRRIFVAAGHTVSIAKSGGEGLAKARELKPGLVITDIMMPEMDGYELCRHIREDPEIGSTLVFLLTFLTDPADVFSALECGADNFIVKPYDEHHLLSKIKQMQSSRESQETDSAKMADEIYFAGKKYLITSGKKKILDLLISAYECAVQKNIELMAAQEDLQRLNEQLEQRVQEMTASIPEELEANRKVEKER